MQFEKLLKCVFRLLWLSWGYFTM